MDEQANHFPNWFTEAGDNPGAAEFALTAEQVEKLDRASQIPLPYPYEAIERAQEMRRNYR